MKRSKNIISDPKQKVSILKEIQKIQKLKDEKRSKKSDKILQEMKNKKLIK